MEKGKYGKMDTNKKNVEKPWMGPNKYVRPPRGPCLKPGSSQGSFQRMSVRRELGALTSQAVLRRK